MKAVEYLEQSPVSHETESGVSACLSKLDAYKLTKAEKLQIINLAPTSEVVVNLVREHLKCINSTQLIEECEERLSDQAMEQLISDVSTTLNVPKKVQQT